MKIFALPIILSLFILTGCQQMEAGEYGVPFYRLPTWMGGGVSQNYFYPGQTVVSVPWREVIRIDTSTQQISWGGAGEGDMQAIEDYVETRARDGNEVGLAVKVQYHVDPNKLTHVVQRVGADKEKIRELVAAVARADIRTHMNVLSTRDFFNQDKRQRAVDAVKKAMELRLAPEGIIIEQVVNTQHRFERPLGNGQYDRSSQETIDQTYASLQETEAEKLKIQAVIEQKKKEFNEEQGRVNRVIEEAEGGRKQAVFRGDAYFQAKEIEAAQVKAVGLSEVEALQKRIAALSGPGGEAMLKLELVQEMLKGKPKFILLESGSSKSSAGIDFTKIDANELIKEAGLFKAASGLQAEPEKNK